MKYENNKVSDIKIAYIGGGSRVWAWGLMSDLVSCDDISGNVFLYDIDYAAAQQNEIIGNKYNNAEGAKSTWNYYAVETIGEALTDADFVIVSIQPATYDEMESDVHTPEKYGIYQSVGDTMGPGGVIRSLRTIPMMEEIALAVKKYSPDAWVINYTNPMTVCVDTLYKAFPQIKAFGCCHEVFDTQKLLGAVLKEQLGIEGIKREEVKVNVIGVNHFTWLTEATYNNIDIFPHYVEFCKKYSETGYGGINNEHWVNSFFLCEEMVKMDLFKRFGYIAAAGDRHLAEFCDGSWYLKDLETVKNWHFGLTPVQWRRDSLAKRTAKGEAIIKGEEKVVINNTGEEGTNQIRALLGLHDLVTNVNLPNRGQIPNLPLGAVVETNAVFRSDSVKPVFAGPIPKEIYPLISRVCGEQQLIVEAGMKKSLDIAFGAFIADPLVRTDLSDSKKLFDEMVANTAEYLKMYK